MEVRFIGRVLPSTGKIHQNQEVASGGGTAALSKLHIVRMPRKCW